MGVIIEDLEDHEGYGARRLKDGTLTSTSSTETMSVETYVACCSCGWQGTSLAVFEDGNEEACRAWENDHAIPLLRLTPPHHVTAAVDTARRAVAGLAQDRPLTALRVLREVNRWTDLLAGRVASPHANTGSRFRRLPRPRASGLTGDAPASRRGRCPGHHRPG